MSKPASAALRAAVEQLDSGQGSVGAHRLRRQRQRGCVALVPEVRADFRNLVGVAGHRGVLDADSAPAAIGLDGTERRSCAWPARAESRCVRDLVKAGRQRPGPNADRLEQERVFGVHRPVLQAH